MYNVELEEVKQLKEEVTRLKEKNAKIDDDFLGLRHSYADLKRKYEEKREAYEGLVRKQKTERDYTHRIKQDLYATNKELTMRAEDRNMTLSAEHQWKNLYEDIKRETTQETLKTMKNDVNDLKDKMSQIHGLKDQLSQILEALTILDGKCDATTRHEGLISSHPAMSQTQHVNTQGTTTPFPHYSFLQVTFHPLRNLLTK